MNLKNINIFKEKYKPNKYSYKGNVIIFENQENKYVIKEDKSNLKDFYKYLNTKNFNKYVNIVDQENNMNVYEYLEDDNLTKEEKLQDLIKIISSLHYKTSYYKDVREDTFKEIYDNILNNINYLKDKYNKYFDTFFNNNYLSPSISLFMQNYSKIKNNLDFTLNELNNWYDLIKDTNKIRVCTLHGNLKSNHIINNKLISFDKHKIDTPILDLVILYKNEYFDINFDNLLKEYNNTNKLDDNELKLFFVMISLPNEIILNNNELISVCNIRKNLDYIYKTENLIRPYYLKNQDKEN